VAGPTAVGKTATTIHLANFFNTEIISADSRQFYKELNIGVAKPKAKELSAVKHHFINSISIMDYYSAGDFERDAEKTLEILFAKYNIVFAVGGSGLYINALLHGLDDMPKADLDLRNTLKQIYNQSGIYALQQILITENPEKYNTIDTNNPQRLMRAIELTKQKATPAKKTNNKPYETLLIVLNTNRNILYQNINSRVEKMFNSGLVSEAQQLIAFKHLTALQTVGYTELFDYFENKILFEAAIEKIKQHTRNYAKKQITWFKKQSHAYWFDPSDLKGIAKLIEEKLAT